MTQSGSGKLIKREDLNFALKFKDFTFAKFRHMCILSGCDYASSVRGIGLQRAITVLEAADNKGTQWAITKIREILHKPSLIIHEGYYEIFEKADSQCSTLTPKEWFHLMEMSPMSFLKPTFCILYYNPKGFYLEI